jgi:hypothetical protein
VEEYDGEPFYKISGTPKIVHFPPTQPTIRLFTITSLTIQFSTAGLVIMNTVINLDVGLQ